MKLEIYKRCVLMSPTNNCITAKQSEQHFGMKMAKNLFLQYFLGYGRYTVDLHESYEASLLYIFDNLSNETSLAFLRLANLSEQRVVVVVVVVDLFITNFPARYIDDFCRRSRQPRCARLKGDFCCRRSHDGCISKLKNLKCFSTDYVNFI